MFFSYHRSSFPWVFCSWDSFEPHHSGFKSQIVALSLWCMMFLIRRVFCRESIECSHGIVSKYVLNFYLQFFWPQWQSFSCSTFAEFQYIDFYTLLSSQPPFVLHSYLSDGIATSANKQVPSFLFLTIVRPVCQTLSIRLYPLIPQHRYIFKLCYRLRYVGVPVLCCCNSLLLHA
jgi:hypothetical protein